MFFNKKDKESKFWNWFVENQEYYYNQIENVNEKDALFKALSKKLKKINSDLVFEFSPIHENGIRELTISADGISSCFVDVENLVKQSPTIQNWKFNAFRQPLMNDSLSITYCNLSIGYSDIFFRYQDGMYGELGIELNIRNYSNLPEYQSAVYILLDTLIGEYDTTKGIDWIEWVKLDETKIDQLLPFVSLRDIVNQKK